MGQVPAKSFLPPVPYGSSMAANTLNQVSKATVVPQTPLIPNTFTDPGTTVTGTAQPKQPQTPAANPIRSNPIPAVRNPFMSRYGL